MNLSIDSQNAMDYVKKTWSDVTGSSEFSNKEQLEKICKILHPEALEAEVSSVI